MNVTCPNSKCGQSIAIEREHAGTAATCPSCGQSMQMPDLSEFPADRTTMPADAEMTSRRFLPICVVLLAVASCVAGWFLFRGQSVHAAIVKEGATVIIRGRMFGTEPSRTVCAVVLNGTGEFDKEKRISMTWSNGKVTAPWVHQTSTSWFGEKAEFKVIFLFNAEGNVSPRRLAFGDERWRCKIIPATELFEALPPHMNTTIR